jgi:hypothetical protein
MTPKELIAEARRRSGPRAALFQDTRGLLGDLADALEASEVVADECRALFRATGYGIPLRSMISEALARLEASEAAREKMIRPEVADALLDEANAARDKMSDTAERLCNALEEAQTALEEERQRRCNSERVGIELEDELEEVRAERDAAIARAEKAEAGWADSIRLRVAADVHYEEQIDAAIASAAAMRAALAVVRNEIAPLGQYFPAPVIELINAALRDTAGAEKAKPR